MFFLRVLQRSDDDQRLGYRGTDSEGSAALIGHDRSERCKCG
jgi:hypothetical protein